MGVILPMLLLPVLAAQEPEQPVFRTETSLALVRFHVARKNRYVDNLQASDVILLEDGAPRNITLFEGGSAAKRSVPVELMLVFDISGSVTHKGLLDLLTFQQSLLDGLPNLHLSVYGFTSKLFRFSTPTRNLPQLERAFRQVLDWKPGATPRPTIIALELPAKRKQARGASWIYEAVAAAARDASSTPARATRMMLVFSDGFPTTDTRPDDVAPLLREIGIPIYPVALGHALIAERARNIRERSTTPTGQLKDGARRQMDRLEDQERDIQDFASLGELTGGRSFDPPEVTPPILRQILTAMSAQVLYEYVVGFTPEPSGTPRKHKLEVRLRSKDMGKVLGGSRTIQH